MSGFSRASLVDARGRQIIEPFIRERASDGQFVMNDKGPLARELQQTIGDYLVNGADNRLWAVELKTEAENKTKNLFLESWSNRNLESEENHLSIGPNPGWFLKIKAELLFYVFLNSECDRTDNTFPAQLFIYRLYKLRQHLLRHESGGQPAINRYFQRPQAKYNQRNDTWGWCVPISHIGKEQGFIAEYQYAEGEWLRRPQGMWEAAE